MSQMRLALVLAIALTAPIFAGCLEIVKDSDESNNQSAVKRSATPRTVVPRATGTMTGDETTEGPTAVACGGITIPPENIYCATKMIRLDGVVGGMEELPVTLDTFVGDINVQGVEGDEWGVVATLEARGGSEQEAIANLDNIVFSWSHEGADGHNLRVVAEKKDPQTQNGESVSYDATLPASLKYFLTCDNAAGDMDVASILGSQVFLDSASGDLAATDIVSDWFFADTASGSIELTKITSDEVHADSASGDVHIQGTIRQTTADTASGDTRLDIEGESIVVDGASGSIEAKFAPTGSGSLDLHTASGSVTLLLLEGPEYGYSVDASTSSGSVTINLKDGQVSGEDEDKHFVSSNYSKRAKRTEVEARSTSGSVSVGPA